MRFTRRLLVLMVLGGLVLAAAHGVIAQEDDPARFMPSEAELAATPPDPASDDPVVRGEYLVRVQMGCVGCHGTFQETGPIPGVVPLTAELGGGEPFEIPDTFTVYASNLTQLGAWSDEEIETAIRYGIRPDGTGLAPIMPFPLYQQITAQDMTDIIAYLRSLEAVENTVPEAEYAAPGMGPEMFAQLYMAAFDMQAAPPSPDFTDPVQRGTYIANVAACMHCHGQLDPMTFLPTPAPEGLPWGDLVGAALLPFAMENYTDDEIIRVLETGVMNDGDLALGMPWPSYQHMPQADHEALVAWIRSQPDVTLEDRQMPMTEGGGEAPPAETPATTPEAGS